MAHVVWMICKMVSMIGLPGTVALGVSPNEAVQIYLTPTSLPSQMSAIIVRSVYSTLSTSFNQTCPDTFQLPFIVPNHALRDLFKRLQTSFHLSPPAHPTNHRSHDAIPGTYGLFRRSASGDQNWHQATYD